ncbi:MAG: ABC transporter ATP-binding protein [Thermoprotei archaeon]|nr:MAG: ABC transporter ATP-binding protein [Thermoprotei archaeon]
MTLLDIKGLKVYYYLPDAVVRAVDKVDLSISDGEILGIVGESGSGKSTLGLSIVKLVPPPGRIVEGEILFERVNLVKLPEKEMSKIRGKKISMVFQDPLTSLDPLMRIGDQLVETIVTHQNLSEEESRKMAKKYLEMVGIPGDRLRDYPHQFSGGMRQRAMIAMAIATSPRLVIADEPTTALDVIVQAQIMKLFSKLREELGISFIIITHDISIVMEVADKIGVMYGGHLVEYGSVEELYEEPLHPYTKELLRAVPNIEVKDVELRYIPGDPPDLSNPPPGCRFHPRCPHAMDICKEEIPDKRFRNEHMVRCHLYG